MAIRNAPTPDKALVESLRKDAALYRRIGEDARADRFDVTADRLAILSQHGELVEAAFRLGFSLGNLAGGGKADRSTVDRAWENSRAALSQPQHGGLVEALKERLRSGGPDRDEWTDAGMEDAFFRWPVIERELRAALTSSDSPVVGEEKAYCNKCGFFGKPQQGGAHLRPSDGEMCNYTASAPKPTPTDTADRSCTCHPDDRPEGPCPQKFAASACIDTADRREAVAQALAENHILISDGQYRLAAENITSLIAVPSEGFVMVPVEPTNEMLHAGSDAAACFGTPLTRTANAYRAMIAARPGADA